MGTSFGARGLTILEIVGGVIVLAMFILMFFPTISRVNSIAPSIMCLSQVRLLTSYKILYALEHDNRFTTVWDQASEDTPPDAHDDEPSSLRDYDSKWFDEITQCPEVSEDDLDDLRAKGVKPEQGEELSSYGINPAMYFPSWDFSWGAMPDPDKTYLIGEQAIEPFARMITADSFAVLPGDKPRWVRLPAHQPQRGYRHTNQNGVANMGFADGHAEYVEEPQLELASEHWAWWDTNLDDWAPSEQGDCACNK